MTCYSYRFIGRRMSSVRQGLAAARADLLRRMNEREAYAQAIALCGNNAKRAHLQRRLDEMLNFVL